MTGKYTIKNLNSTPLLIIKNIKTDFVKQHSLLLKTMPFIKISSEESSNATEHKDDGSGLQLAWSDCLRVRMKDTSKIKVEMLDKNDESNVIF